MFALVHAFYGTMQYVLILDIYTYYNIVALCTFMVLQLIQFANLLYILFLPLPYMQTAIRQKDCIVIENTVRVLTHNGVCGQYIFQVQ